MKLSAPLHLAALYALSPLAAAAPTSHHGADLEVVYQFPNGTWVENLTFHPNGLLYVGFLSNGSIWKLDPACPRDPPTPAFHFPGKTAVNGLVPLGPDRLAVVAGRVSPAGIESADPQWTVYDLAVPRDRPARVRRAYDFPTARYLNGMTAVPGAPDVLLLAGALSGDVWRLDLRTGAGTRRAAFSDPLFAFQSPPVAPVNTNGVRARGGRLYFTNSDQNVYGSLPLTRDGFKAGPASVLSRDLPGLDDLELAPDGGAYLPSILQRVVWKSPPGGGPVTVVAGSAEERRLDHPDSCRLRPGKEKELWTTTAGYSAGLGGGYGGGQIVKIRL